ncbi:uncharacterized protein LOC131018998 [Salvia miltiorrhiza]|uniref:uncharacterized protein LOC131018998 n=1 Tax=Salvia miltiorrhiza TaxID=226208 RepID=UPI0025ABDB83|nr:uncharacterized protein LOC131018998 [Salvia miltiorrhiza]
MDDRRHKTLVIIALLLIRRCLLVLMMMGHHYFKNILPSKRASGRRRLKYKIIDKIPKQVEYLHRVISADDLTCVNKIRMSKDVFSRLCYLLEQAGGLVPTKHVGVEEKVASFLVILAHHSKNRIVKFDFRRSGNTISLSFHSVLHALLRLHHLLLVNPVPVPEDETSEQWRPFKGCLGALDGTYIPVTVPLSDAPRYRNRKGFVSVNVLGVCDRDLKFVHMPLVIEIENR